MKLNGYFIIAKKFLFSRQHSALKGAVLAITLSLLPLVTALTITDAMEKGILSRSIETATYHLQVSPLWQDEAEEEELNELFQTFKKDPRFTYVAIERRNAAVAFSSMGRSGVMIRAINRNFLQDDPSLRNYLRLEEGLDDPTEGLMIGRPLAQKLALKVGDRLRLMSAKREGDDFRPQISSFVVSSIFSTGYEEIDKSWIMMPMDNFMAVFGSENSTVFIGLKVSNPFNNIEGLSAQMNRTLKEGWIAYHWKVLNAYYLQNIQTTRALLMVVLGLIVAIAVLNTSSSILIFYLQNRASVAILQALGTSPTMLKKLFLTCGATVGLVGSVSGVVLGLFLASNVNFFIGFIEKLSNLFNGNADFSFYIDHIPVEVNPPQLIIMIIFITLLSMLSSLKVAGKVAKTKPLALLNQ